MDISDVGVRHAVDFSDGLLIKHTIDFSPQAANVIKEVRNIALVLIVAWAVVSVVNYPRDTSSRN